MQWLSVGTLIKKKMYHNSQVLWARVQGCLYCWIWNNTSPTRQKATGKKSSIKHEIVLYFEYYHSGQVIISQLDRSEKSESFSIVLKALLDQSFLSHTHTTHICCYYWSCPFVASSFDPLIAVNWVEFHFAEASLSPLDC